MKRAVSISLNIPIPLRGLANLKRLARVLMPARGVRYLVTTTPRFEGRSFGTNVVEATLTAVASKGRSLTSEEI